MMMLMMMMITQLCGGWKGDYDEDGLSNAEESEFEAVPYPLMSVSEILWSPDDPTNYDDLLDSAISYVPFASLSRTGSIIENSSGATNQSTTGILDFDPFNQWGSNDVAINFNESSLAWDANDGTVTGTVPFAAYVISTE
mgnify:CR=1 FL=1